ncbi:MAG: GNAT family N-acetyltransferase [Provencibacterium sp.]|jgi:predicted acetyltransferase|nr:GNAT family N-acetyltransferase [Provencibacterium sp.]
MINAQHYYIWVQREHLRVYLGTVNGVSVSTAATIQTEEEASLEFVSTLPEYRRQGAAGGVCSAALEELFENGPGVVTLSASPGSSSLYEQMGFRRCFENIVMQYPLSK